MASQGTGINFLGLINPQLAFKQQQVARQEALAQQLLEQSQQQPDTAKLANPGGLVIPYSKTQGLAQLAKAVGGKYLQGQADQQTLQMYQQLAGGGNGNSTPTAGASAAPSPDQPGFLDRIGSALGFGNSSDSVPASSVGQQMPVTAPASSDNQALAQQLRGGPPPMSGDLLSQARSGTITGNPSMDMAFLMQDPTEYMKAAATRNMPTNEQKNYNDPSMHGLVAGAMAKNAILPDQTYQGRTNVPINMQTGLPLDAPQATQAPGVNPMLPALVQAESGGNPSAVSPAGAGGLTQIMPSTAANPGYGVKPLQGWDGQNPASAPASEQLRFGNDYINAMQDKFGDPRLAAAAYNAGPGRVDAALQKLPAETQAYVPKVAGQAPQQTQFGVDPIAQAEAKKRAEGIGENVAEAEKSVAGISSRIDNAKAILQDQIRLAPDTYSGKLGENILEPAAENAANFKFLPQSDKPSKQALFEQNNANLFTQALPAIIPPGSRMDIPFVQAVKAAEQIPEYGTPAAKIAVAQNQMKLLDFLKENVVNNASLLNELASPPGTPLSPDMMMAVKKFQGMSGSNPVPPSPVIRKYNPATGKIE